MFEDVGSKIQRLAKIIFSFVWSLVVSPFISLVSI